MFYTIKYAIFSFLGLTQSFFVVQTGNFISKAVRGIPEENEINIFSLREKNYPNDMLQELKGVKWKNPTMILIEKKKTEKK